MKTLLILLLTFGPFALLQAQYQDDPQAYEGAREEPAYDNYDDQAYEEPGNYYPDEAPSYDSRPEPRGYEDAHEEEGYNEHPPGREFPEEYSDRPVDDGEYDTSPQESFENFQDTEGYDDY